MPSPKDEMELALTYQGEIHTFQMKRDDYSFGCDGCVDGTAVWYYTFPTGVVACPSCLLEHISNHIDEEKIDE